jgi:Holliday junction resolvase RusA-like endonuclease
VREFLVPGIPVTQGSKRLVRSRSGRPLMLESSKNLRPWRSTVAGCALDAGVRIIDAGVCVEILARYSRPASHFGRRGTLRPSAPERPGYGDCDKIARAVLDALAGIAYRNDRQVCTLRVERVWCKDGEIPGAMIRICPA